MKHSRTKRAGHASERKPRDAAASLGDFLAARPDSWVDLRKFAASAALTTADLEKLLPQLHREGYEIEHHPRKGHRLLRVAERLAADSIRQGLRTSMAGRRILIYQRTPSTNDAAWKLAEAGAPEGTVILAEEQTAGRGRLGRSWNCAAYRGLLLSVILRPDTRPEPGNLTVALSIASALAVRSASGLEARIKWPNDVILNETKVGGILVEKRDSGPGPLVAGIGLNVNQLTEDIPEELRSHATSIRIALGRPLDRNVMARHLLESLDHWYGVCLQGRSDEIEEQWFRLSADLGKTVSVVEDSRSYTGRVVGFSPGEGLLVKLDMGSVKAFRGERVTLGGAQAGTGPLPQSR